MSSATKMVPVECTDEIAEAIAAEANVCGGIAETIWRKALAASPPMQPEQEVERLTSLLHEGMKWMATGERAEWNNRVRLALGSEITGQLQRSNRADDTATGDSSDAAHWQTEPTILEGMQQKHIATDAASETNDAPIPEGMVHWDGGGSAPADWDGGPVLCDDGAMYAAPLEWHRPCGGPEIIAYTPKPSTGATAEGTVSTTDVAKSQGEHDVSQTIGVEQREAIAQIIDPYSFEAWQKCLDNPIHQNLGAEHARRIADHCFGHGVDVARSKADAILANLSPPSVIDPAGERVKALIAKIEAGQFDDLDAVADRWEASVGIQRMMNAIASVFEKHASQDIMDRFREKLAGLMHLAFVEGAAQGVLQLSALQPHSGEEG